MVNILGLSLQFSLSMEVNFYGKNSSYLAAPHPADVPQEETFLCSVNYSLSSWRGMLEEKSISFVLSWLAGFCFSQMAYNQVQGAEWALVRWWLCRSWWKGSTWMVKTDHWHGVRILEERTSVRRGIWFHLNLHTRSTMKSVTVTRGWWSVFANAVTMKVPEGEHGCRRSRTNVDREA